MSTYFLFLVIFCVFSFVIVDLWGYIGSATTVVECDNSYWCTLYAIIFVTFCLGTGFCQLFLPSSKVSIFLKISFVNYCKQSPCTCLHFEKHNTHYLLSLCLTWCGDVSSFISLKDVLYVELTFLSITLHG